MKIKILVLTLIAALCCGSFSAAAASPIAATGGTIVIDTVLSGVEAGVPVLVLILPEINEPTTQEDITASCLPQGTDAAEIISALKSSDLNVEYFDVVLTEEGGMLGVTCKMKPSLSTGLVHVYLKHLGNTEWVKLDEFEHVSQDDIDSLLAVFNGSQSGYKAALQADSDGKRLFEKSSADLNYYEYLVDYEANVNKEATFTDEFCEILFSKRPAEGFDIITLVAAFNESCAWIQLREKEDTLGVLNQYNKKYWDIPTEATDFTTLSKDEQGKILSVVKNGKLSDEALLLDTYNTELVLSLFRSADTREDLAALIGEDSAYKAYFNDARTILENSDVDAYQNLLVLNYVLDNKEDCTDFASVNELFEDAVASIDQDNKTAGGGSSVSSRPVGGGTVALPVTTPTAQEPNPSEASDIPFNDVTVGHWAYPYISQLYQAKVINGISDSEFGVHSSIKRQDFVKILVGILDMELSLQDSTFSDLSVGCYYEPYIMAATESGLISGVGDGKFGMGADITREDVAVIISRVLDDDSTNGATKSFKDAEKIADYAKAAVQKVSAAGIFSGDDAGNFNPKANLSRAEACAVLSRVADTVKGVSK